MVVVCNDFAQLTVRPQLEGPLKSGGRVKRPQREVGGPGIVKQVPSPAIFRLRQHLAIRDMVGFGLGVGRDSLCSNHLWSTSAFVGVEIQGFGYGYGHHALRVSYTVAAPWDRKCRAGPVRHWDLPLVRQETKSSPAGHVWRELGPRLSRDKAQVESGQGPG